MTYRVIIDYGEVELSAMIWSNTPNTDEIYKKTMEHLEREGWTLPPAYPVITITPAPEWDEE